MPTETEYGMADSVSCPECRFEVMQLTATAEPSDPPCLAPSSTLPSTHQGAVTRGRERFALTEPHQHHALALAAANYPGHFYRSEPTASSCPDTSAKPAGSLTYSTAAAAAAAGRAFSCASCPGRTGPCSSTASHEYRTTRRRPWLAD